MLYAINEAIQQENFGKSLTMHIVNFYRIGFLIDHFCHHSKW
jgi:hypothetical protein